MIKIFQLIERMITFHILVFTMGFPKNFKPCWCSSYTFKSFFREFSDVGIKFSSPITCETKVDKKVIKTPKVTCTWYTFPHTDASKPRKRGWKITERHWGWITITSWNTHKQAKVGNSILSQFIAIHFDFGDKCVYLRYPS